MYTYGTGDGESPSGYKQILARRLGHAASSRSLPREFITLNQKIK